MSEGFNRHPFPLCCFRSVARVPVEIQGWHTAVKSAPYHTRFRLSVAALSVYGGVKP